MTAPLTPLTDEQFDSYAEIVQANTWKESKARIVIADARWHRAELAKFGLANALLQSELAKARAENERLRAVLHGIKARLSALEYVGVDLDNDAQCVLHEARAALAPEGKEGG